MKTGRRIFWTARERQEVVQLAVKILRAYPKMPYFRAVGEAQNAALPPERRRVILNKATLGELTDDIEKELNSLVEHRVETNKYETLAAAEDTLAAAARSVAARFEAELRSALVSSTAKIVKQAVEGKL